MSSTKRSEIKQEVSFDCYILHHLLQPLCIQIAYAENLCKELKNQIVELEGKLEQGNTRLQTPASKQAMTNELKEVRKLLKKYTDQIDHLKTHDSLTVKIVMALSLVVFVVWMLVVLTNNNWDQNSKFESAIHDNIHSDLYPK